MTDENPLVAWRQWFRENAVQSLDDLDDKGDGVTITLIQEGETAPDDPRVWRLSEVDALRLENEFLQERVARLTDDLTSTRLELLTSDALREGLLKGLEDTYICEVALRLRLEKQAELVAAAKALYEFLQSDQIDVGEALRLREELHQATAEYLEKEPS